MEASTVSAAHLGAPPIGAGELALARRVERRVSVAMIVAHALGALDVFVLLFFVLPDVAADENLTANLAAIAVYLPLATLVGYRLGTQLSPERYPWIRERRAPTEAEREKVVRSPLLCLRHSAALWAGGAVLFVAINAPTSLELAKHIATTIVLGGLTTCALAYLLVERLMRPITALALAAAPPRRAAWPGVEGRIVLTWLASTGIPIIGLVMVCVHTLTDDSVTREELLLAVGVLSLAAFALGLAMTLVAARTVSTPLRSVRRALERVEQGDLRAGVPVDDASEVGMVQTGFNRMVGGLRERERVQDLFSRQVGEDVARQAIESDPRLGGEVGDVAVLFVDLVGSTTYAATAPPERVVARLNRFFATVVEVVESHGGWVNKFQGDAALCVFGAPADLPDAAACALRAGRTLRERLHHLGFDAGIGLSAGPAVAGWVGAESRFEYTVIGDPVNEAARLCELAKGRDDRLVASAAIVERASGEEGRRWRLGEATVLRGRTAPTTLAVPG